MDRRWITEGVKDKIVEDFKKGYKVSELVTKYVLSARTIRAILKERLGEDGYRQVMKYWGGRNRRIGGAKIELIKTLSTLGFNDNEIAAIIGVTSTTVGKYRRKLGLPPVGKTCSSIVNMVLPKYVRKYGR